MAAILRKKSGGEKNKKKIKENEKEKKKEKNPYSERGMDKFSVLLAEIEAKREKIAAKFGIPLSSIKFSIRSRRKLVPIISSLSESQNPTSISDSGHGVNLADKTSDPMVPNDSCASRETLTVANDDSSSKIAVVVTSKASSSSKGKAKPWAVEKLLPLGLKVAMSASRKNINSKKAVEGSMDIHNAVQSSNLADKARHSSPSTMETSRKFVDHSHASTSASSSSQMEGFHSHFSVRKNEIEEVEEVEEEEEEEEEEHQNKRSKTVKFARVLSPPFSEAPSSSPPNSSILKVLHPDNLKASIAEKFSQKILASSSRSGGFCIHVQALTGLSCIVVALSGLFINRLAATLCIICWCYIALPYLRKTIGDSSIHHQQQKHRDNHSHGNIERGSQQISSHGNLTSNIIRGQLVQSNKKLHLSDRNKNKKPPIDLNSREYKKKVFMDGLLNRKQA